MCITVYHCVSLWITVYHWVRVIKWHKSITTTIIIVFLNHHATSWCEIMDWKSQAALFRLWTNLTKESPIVLIGPNTFPQVLKWKFWTQLTKDNDMMMGGQRRGGVIEGCLIICYAMMMMMTIGRAQRWHDHDKGRISDINICQNGLAHTICSSTFPI